MSSIVINVSGDLHLHVGDQEKLDEVITKLNSLGIQLTAQGELIVATNAELLAELVEANNTTNEIANDIADLKARITGGLSAEEANVVLAELDALNARLTGVAAEHTA